MPIAHLSVSRMLEKRFLHLSNSTIIEHIPYLFSGDIQNNLKVQPTIQNHLTQNKQQIVRNQFSN